MVEVGDEASHSMMASWDRTVSFLELTGDANPLHWDEEAAKESGRFEGRVVPGWLTASIIPTSLAKLGETVVFMSQEVEFRRPVYVGEVLEARVVVVEALAEDIYRCETWVNTSKEKRAADGEAVVLVES